MFQIVRTYSAVVVSHNKALIRIIFRGSTPKKVKVLGYVVLASLWIFQVSRDTQENKTYFLGIFNE